MCGSKRGWRAKFKAEAPIITLFSKSYSHVFATEKAKGRPKAMMVAKFGWCCPAGWAFFDPAVRNMSVCA